MAPLNQKYTTTFGNNFVITSLKWITFYSFNVYYGLVLIQGLCVKFMLKGLSVFFSLFTEI